MSCEEYFITLLCRDNNPEESIRVRFADHTGELTARLPVNVLEDILGYTVSK